MAKFIATELGFYKGGRIRKGATFEAPEDFKAKWAVPAREIAKTEVVAKGKTLSVPDRGPAPAPGKGTPGADLA